MAMATGSGGGGGMQSDINITPMIDVLLVLLIIFLVIQPALQKGIEVQVPPIEEQEATEPPPDQIVLEVQAGPSYSINQIPVPANQLRQRIEQIFAQRERDVLFVKGAEDILYGDVVRAMDAARGAGIAVVGLTPRE